MTDRGIEAPKSDQIDPLELLKPLSGWLPELFPRPNTLSDAEISRLEKQLKDFVGGGQALFWQRQGMYIGSAMLAGFYYSGWIAILCLTLFQFTEFIDLRISKQVLRWQGGDAKRAVRFHYELFFSSALSASSVSLFAYLVARMEGPSAHFTPLFFLFTAALFAAVNNHQIPRILMARLVVYGFVFLFIPVYDLWVVKPSLDSVLWLQFATVLFVLYFVVDCSSIFLRLYRRGLDQMDELRRERDRATAAYEVKSQFVSTVSHELRTPLTSIMGALGLLDSGAFNDQPDRAEKILGIAHKNSKRLSNLINDLLDLQKLESGMMTYEFAPVNLTDLVNEAIESMDGFSDSADVTIAVVESEDDLTVHADHDRLLQVLANLMSNAVKFSKEGSKVEISLTSSQQKAKIYVRDYGIGIPENSRDVVFGRFSQIDSSDHRAFDGTGLGMSITEQIMTAHRGNIDYESVLGEGTTFILEFWLE